MWRKVRILAAVCFFTAISLLFVDVSGTLSPAWFFLAKMQWMPALLSGSVFIVGALLALSLIFGRVYCSVICPLGVLQDVLVHFKPKRRYAYTKAQPLWRFAFLVLFIGSWLFSLPIIFTFLEPYSAFGRIATDIFAPLWTYTSNILASLAERMDSFLIGPSPVLQKGVAALGGALFTLALLAFLAIRNGRTWCNTFCPVGTALGYTNKMALIRPRIHEGNCTRCGQCAKHCKASCIDHKNASIDASRCIACYTCHAVCKFKAIQLLPFAKKQEQESVPSTSANTPNTSRRAFLQSLVPVSMGGAALTHTTSHAATYGEPKEATNQRQVEALGIAKNRPQREHPITPPGSLGLRNFEKNCTACQLCVAACPHHVLRSFDNGNGMLQPTMSFEHGFCRTNCVKCSEVCPTSAIRPISVAEKSVIQCGQARVHLEHCIINADKRACTACSRACPTEAITLVPNPQGGGHKIPVVNNEKCLGCGACEFVCPVRPLAAIHVVGNKEHQRLVM